MVDPDCVWTHFNRICDFGGRLCGSESENNALDYAWDYLTSLNVGSLSIHPVDYDGWAPLASKILIDRQAFEATALPGCGAMPSTGLELDVVDADRGSEYELKALASQIRGRAVLVTHEYMFAVDHVHRSRKIDMALSLGAAAFVIANPWPDSGMVAGDASCQLPAFGVSKQTGEVLRMAAKQAKRVFFNLNCSSEPKATRTIDWYLPAIPATQMNEKREIIICAHIDGHMLSQSAMDNASGVAVVLALSALMKQRRSRSCAIRLLIFSAEERGLHGSQQYVASLSSAQRKRIIGVLNLDCVAGSSSLCAMTSGFDILSKVVRLASNATSIPVRHFEPLVPNSDHYNFAVKGIPALRLIAGFDETDSRLRHVLTSADNKDLVQKQELDQALALTMAMIGAMENEI